MKKIYIFDSVLKKLLNILPTHSIFPKLFQLNVIKFYWLILIQSTFNMFEELGSAFVNIILVQESLIWKIKYGKSFISRWVRI